MFTRPRISSRRRPTSSCGQASHEVSLCFRDCCKLFVLLEPTPIFISRLRAIQDDMIPIATLLRAVLGHRPMHSSEGWNSSFMLRLGLSWRRGHGPAHINAMKSGAEFGIVLSHYDCCLISVSPLLQLCHGTHEWTCLYLGTVSPLPRMVLFGLWVFF